MRLRSKFLKYLVHHERVANFAILFCVYLYTCNNVAFTHISLKHTLLFLGTLCLLWQGCKSFKESEKPVSGIKLVGETATATTLLPENKLVFSGACVGSSPLAKAILGIRYLPEVWELAAPLPIKEYKFDQEIALSGTFQQVDDSTFLPTDTDLPQGRLEIYSYVLDADGRRSDSNLVFKYLRNFRYPLLAVSAPAVSLLYTRARAGDSLSVAGTLVDYDTRTTVSAKVCLITDNGLACRKDSVIFNRTFVDSQAPFAGKIEVPLEALTGQRYRVKVSGHTTRGTTYSIMPGIEIIPPLQ